MFALATVMIGGSAVVWLAGAFGGILGGAGPVVLGPSQATGALAHLPRHLGDPAAAWSASSRGDLPGRTGMTAALVAACLVSSSRSPCSRRCNARGAAGTADAGGARGGRAAATCVSCGSGGRSAGG